MPKKAGAVKSIEVLLNEEEMRILNRTTRGRAECKNFHYEFLGG
jgi:hypothetical protein